MNKLVLFNSIRTTILQGKIKFVPLNSRWYCKVEDESFESKGNKNQNESTNEKKSKSNLTRLNTLLKEMIEVSPKVTPQTLELAKPAAKIEKLKKILENKKKIENPTDEGIVSAAKEVAKTLGGDEKQTEHELLKKLLGTKEEQSSDTITSLSDIFKGMKIDRSKPEVVQKSRSEQVRQLMNRNVAWQQPRQGRAKTAASFEKREITKFDKIDLYGSEPLGIFTCDLKEYKDFVTNKTWKVLAERELKLMITHPPSNYFQQMILWTEQGKLWKFPIDNEQGFEEENNISFAEHIFLDKYLEPWCPNRGPIRHFMELVCVGLSKNPYLTVSAKREHIEWYKSYFEDKKGLLKDVGITLTEKIASE